MLGAVKGGLLVVIALGICSIITSLSLPGISSNITNSINNTKATKFVYTYVDKFIDAKLDGESFNEIIAGLFDKEVAEKQEANSSLTLLKRNGKDVYEFAIGEEVDYSEILVVYNNGKETEYISLHETNFSPKIDTSKPITNATSTITIYGKTIEFKYTVVAAE